MEELIFLVFAGLLVVFQLLTCIFAKKVWLRWLPLLVSILLAVFCFIMYLGSNQENWAYILLIGLLGIVLTLQGVILLINRFIR